MKTINVFYQGEGLVEMQHLEIESNSTFERLKARLVEVHGISLDAQLFLENENEPISEEAHLTDFASPKGLKVHIHQCQRIEVSVTFNGETVEHQFGPGTTIAHVKRWAAENEFGMSAEEAGEHVLQITGTNERPTPSTHIGSLTEGKECNLAFDLVPEERVNGAARKTHEKP